MNNQGKSSKWQKIITKKEGQKQCNKRKKKKKKEKRKKQLYYDLYYIVNAIRNVSLNSSRETTVRNTILVSKWANIVYKLIRSDPHQSLGQTATQKEQVTSRIHLLRWLSWIRRPTGDQEVAGSTPAEVGNILSWRLIMKYFLRSFSPFRWFKKGRTLSVSGERMCTILVNRLED